ncbi:adenosylcobinamide-GDP ribazoletransferase [Ancylobacter lacus]|uniref:adenosylcobinamide-GDP ribazoletransferase n=1 Tax=Ancylobacter lacus TaxID=2579970 RepID=UPI001BCBCA03|nr:adenosylcobinamide-GDP ribazoletransferase [Ancylobacter lacus]MBS7541281.1 adenosylcobinamide-GDP ribazoletransferase [Ancylobacter lacus]
MTLNDNEPPVSAASFPWELLCALPPALRFLSRLPVPVMPFETKLDIHLPPDLDRLAPALPLAGALIGALGAAVLVAALLAGLPPLVAATMGVAALVIATGAFHEDGLADFADGMGGMTAERRLAIMKDSRVGSFGVLALVISILLRVAALDGLAADAPVLAAAGLIAASGAARLAGVHVLHALPPARADGMASTAGAVGRAAMLRAGAVALILCAALVLPGLGLLALLAALAAGGLATLLVERSARARLGGQTGDVAGAATQAAEIAFLLALLIFARHA